MDLILWRHADAGTGTDGPEDLQRALSSKGEIQAERMANWLNLRLPETTKIFVSPALRAQQTARALKRKFRTEEKLAHDRSLEEALECCGFPGSKQTALLIGHQPTLGLIATHLLSGLADSPAMSITKAGVVWLRHRERNAGPEIVLRAFMSAEFV
jgi:phosphohistidine phosphatase